MINMNMLLEYLSELEKNNHREWYAAHQKERKQAEQEFEKLLHELIFEIGKFDDHIPLLDPKDLTFKMVRDTRFCKDKTPYNPCFRAHIAPKGKLPIPVGYFICIKPHGESFFGGGLFADVFANATSMIRDYINLHPKELSDILSEPSFKNDFVVKGSRLKKVPKGYDPTHPMATYLKNKSWFLEYYVEDEIVLQEDLFLKTAKEKFEEMMPFHEYLNRALDGFVMPTR